MIYLIGSLRNPEVPIIANRLRAAGHNVFDDWYAAGPEADDYWRKYELARGHTYKQALNGYAAKNVFDFDKQHLDMAEYGVLVLPAGRSGHLELGYLIGRGRQGFILLDNDYIGENARFDVMYRHATVVSTVEELIESLKNNGRQVRQL